MTNRTDDKNYSSELTKKNPPLYIIYISLFVAGFLLLSDSVGVFALQKLATRLGIAILFSVIAILITKKHLLGWIAIAIVWAAVIVLLLF